MWDRNYEIARGDLYKAAEAAENAHELKTVYPYESFVVRVDGRAFHTFTRGLEKPFSDVLNQCRDAAASAVIHSLRPTFAYHQSDEISYVWDAVESPAAHPFDGRVDKILSLAASLTSVAFAMKYVELTGDYSKHPHFDARIAFRSGSKDALAKSIENVMWRENDALRNSMQMFGQSIFSHKQLHKKSVGEIYDMCLEAGSDWWASAPEFRRGTYMKRGVHQVVIPEVQRLAIPEAHRPPAGTSVTRRTDVKCFFDDWDIDRRLAEFTGNSDGQ